MTRTVQLAVLGGIFMMVVPRLAPAQEGGSTEYARPGPYLGIALAYGIENVIFNAEFSYVLPAGDLDAFQFIPLVFGIQYRF
jgi:hypothetical protein